MATLKEYYQKDSEKLLTLHQNFPCCDAKTKEVIITIIGKLHFDFESCSLYVSIFIPKTEKIECPARVALSNLDKILNLKDDTSITVAIPGDMTVSANDLVFTGRVFIYDENELSEENRSYIFSKAKENGHDIKFRGISYAEERSKLEKPLAFISHDSRDKDSLVRELALELSKLMCPVWYDEYSLKVGDSLRANIEQGLKETKKCVVILSPNFLSNEGWGKAEFDSIFTREIIEKNNVMLPIWHNVGVQEVYQYSPRLADKVGLNSSIGIPELARKLSNVIKQ